MRDGNIKGMGSRFVVKHTVFVDLGEYFEMWMLKNVVPIFFVT